MKKKLLIWGTAVALATVGCYQEEHFSFPGPYDVDGSPASGDTLFTSEDTLPNPFGRAHVNGHWLIKDNVVDYEQVGFRAYSDFQPEVPTSNLSWFDEGTGFAFRQHYNANSISDADHFNGDALSYESNDLYSRGFLECGQGKSWYVYAKISVNYIDGNRRFDNNFYIGNDGFEKRCVFFSNHKDSNYPCCTWAIGGGSTLGILDALYHDGKYYWGPYTDLEIECVYTNGMLMFGFNNTWMFTYAPTLEEVSFPVIFRPWRNSWNFHDLYVEGDYVPATDMAAYRNEAHYATIQHPALAEQGGEVLLFAEGRKYNIELTNDVNAVRSNATDIILKRSTDGGETFGEPEVVVGGDETVNMSPCVVKGQDGTLHLFYTVAPAGVPFGEGNLVYHRTSTDGTSWSEAQEVAATLAGYENYTVETLNGHGACLEDGTLIVPVHYTLGRNGLIAMLVSKDGGATWTLGDAISGLRNVSCDVWTEGNEAVCLLASTDATSRTLARSTDGGMTWSTPEANSVETGAAGYALDGATAVATNGTWIHFSPTDRENGSAHSATVLPSSWTQEVLNEKFMYIADAPDMCTGMIVTTSADQGATWSTPADVFTRTAFSEYVYRVGNMDAIALEDGTVVCVYEGGMEVPYEGLKVYKMTVQ